MSFGEVREVHLEDVVDLDPEVLLDRLDRERRAADRVGGVDLVAAVAGDVDDRVARDRELRAVRRRRSAAAGCCPSGSGRRRRRPAPSCPACARSEPRTSVVCGLVRPTPPPASRACAESGTASCWSVALIEEQDERAARASRRRASASHRERRAPTVMRAAPLRRRPRRAVCRAARRAASSPSRPRCSRPRAGAVELVARGGAAVSVGSGIERCRVAGRWPTPA